MICESRHSITMRQFAENLKDIQFRFLYSYAIINVYIGGGERFTPLKQINKQDIQSDSSL